MRATMKDVAERAGVSPKTVSNVVNGVVFVKPTTRERVENAMRELDYVPNLSARSLRNGRSGVLALALPHLATQYSAETIGAFVEVAHERGWAVQVEQTGASPDREFELISRARAHLVDGLILNPVTLEDSAIATVDVLPPLVLIGEVEQSLVDQVAVSNATSARDVTRHLVARGGRRIAVVGAPDATHETATGRARRDGYRQALAEAGIAHDPSLEIGCGDWTAASAAACLVRHLDGGGELPDAIFCFTDTIALGVLNVLWSRGVRVPGDVLVAGFDDTADSAYAVPSLTTVRFSRRELAERAIELLDRRISKPSEPPSIVELSYAVVERASTARA